MAEPAVLFVNLRGVPAEDRAALMAARRLGYAVDLVAPALPAHAAGLVREFRAADTEDPSQGLRAACTLARPNGVLTWGDLGVELTARIGEELALPALTPEAAHRARHKPTMRDAAARVPGLVGRHKAITTRADLEPALREVGFPAVLKPAAAAGSNGIFEVRNPAEAAAAFDRLTAWLPGTPRPWHGGLILDEFLEGPEFSVEGWVHDGTVSIAGITDKWTTDPYHLEYQHIHPSGRSEADQRAIREGTEQVVRALGLDHCAFHLECKLTPRGFRLIEVAGRAPGDFIASHLVPLSTGIDFHANCIRVACGQPPRLPPPDSLHAGVRFLLADRAGRFDALDGLADVLRMGSVEHVFMEVPVGAPLLLPPDDYDLQRVAAVVARAPAYDAVREQLDEAARIGQPRVGPVS